MENPRILGVGPRVAALLREVYPQRPRAKLIARDFDVSPKTAERWLAGHAPVVADLEVMALKWEVRFIEILFPEAVAARDRRILELQRELRVGGSGQTPPDGSGGTRYSVREGSANPPTRRPPPPARREVLLSDLAAEVEAVASVRKAAGRQGWWRRLLAHAIA